ncbi:MAG: hypothetical protein II393_02185, partial [Cytophagales bacterium]|nr:hypothetical protein [Cytophagales bacterium]
MKKVFYSLVTLLSLYICFCGLRLYKQRIDSAFVKKIINIQQSLCNKISKVDYVKISCERKLETIAKEKTKNGNDKTSNVDLAEKQEEEDAYKNLKNEAEEGLINLTTKEKELSHYILKCNHGYISRALRKEAKEYIDKYEEQISWLNEIVDTLENEFKKLKDKQAKKEEERKKANEETKKIKQQEENKEKAEKKEEDKKNKDEEKKKEDDKKKDDEAKKKEDEKKKKEEEAKKKEDE